MCKIALALIMYSISYKERTDIQRSGVKLM